MTDILDDVEIRFNCPNEGCPGEIRTTFGKLKANPEITCRTCWIKTEVRYTDEELDAARAAIAAPEKGQSGA
ncbi:MAG TPA: hypothetical protein VIT45_06290 [Allosphingosinicella sp.]